MLYERSLEIEQRLQAVLQLIRTGKYSTPALAREVGVSIPTISRAVTALRERGHEIQAEKHAAGWRYTLLHDRRPKSLKNGKRSHRSAPFRPKVTH
jgi:biotin operon repressor